MTDFQLPHSPSDASSDEDSIVKPENEDYERVLESFPLSETELEMLLTTRERLSAKECSISSVSGRTDVASNFVESSLFPELFLREFFETALSSVYVVGSRLDQMEHWTFLEAIVTCLGRRGPRSVYDLLFSYCLITDGCESVRAEKVVNLVYRTVLACRVLHVAMPNVELNIKTPSSWVASFPPDHHFSRQGFLDWISRIMPYAYNAVSTMFHCIFFSPDHLNFQPAPFTLPQLDAETLLWAHPWDPLPVALACHYHNLGGQWRRLYSNNEDSVSFRAFANALIGYRGPTIILIKSTAGDAFGFFTDSVWKYSCNWYGSDADSFIFCSEPLGFFHPTGVGKTQQYLFLPPSHRQKDLKGLAIGGISADCPRIHLTESLERCRAVPVDSTFESGRILSDDLESHFDVDILEVFAISTSEEEFKMFRKSGELQVAVREATRKQAASVDRGQFVDDFVAGAFLNKGFEHREHTNGRFEFRRDGS